MSFRNFALAVCTSVLLLIPVTVINANPPQEPAISEDGAVLELAGTAFWNNAYYCDAVGDYVFLTMDFGLVILDVSDKTDPQIASRLYMPSGTNRLQVVGNYAYICGGGDMSTGTDWATLTIVDVSDVYNPTILSCYQHPDSAMSRGVKVVGNSAFVAGDGGLHIIGIADPTSPYEISTLSYISGLDLEIVDDTAFVITQSRVYGVDVTDINYPSNVFPTIYTGTYYSNGIEVANNLVYVANGGSGLTIIDPYHGEPYVLSDYPIGGMSRDLVLVDDTIVFIGGEYSNSVKVLNVADPYAVDSIAKCGSFGNKAVGMDLDNDYLYVARDKSGLLINDVSNPAYPFQVGAFKECNGKPRAVEVRGNTGYLMFMDTIRIVDLSDPANITQIGWAEVGMNDAIEIVGDIMLIGNTNGVTSVDISNPASAVCLGTCLTGNHYVKSIDVRGDYAYITMWRYGYGIVDISDPNNLVMVGSYIDSDYWPAEYNVGNVSMILVDGYALASFYSSESLESGFLVLDISDPTNPYPVKEHVLPGAVVSVDVMDSKLFFAHGASDSMFVWDISDPLNPVHTASWRPPDFGHFCSYIISHAGGYLLVEEWYSHTLLAVDPSGWSGSCGGGEIARFINHRTATGIATEGNHIYMSSRGGFAALTLKLDFVCGDVNDDGGFGPDIADLVYLVDFMFTGGPPPPNMVAANIDGEPGITISDLVFLVDFMFNNGPPPICE